MSLRQFHSEALQLSTWAFYYLASSILKVSGLVPLRSRKTSKSPLFLFLHVLILTNCFLVGGPLSLGLQSARVLPVWHLSWALGLFLSSAPETSEF